MEFKSCMVYNEQYGDVSGEAHFEERQPNKKEDEEGIEYNFYSAKLEKLKFKSSNTNDIK